MFMAFYSSIYRIVYRLVLMDEWCLWVGLPYMSYSNPHKDACHITININATIVIKVTINH